MTDKEALEQGWRASDPRQDPLRCYLVNDAGQRLDVQPVSDIDWEAYEEFLLDIEDV